MQQFTGDRAQALLDQMTTAEKAGQVTQYFRFGEAALRNERYAREAAKMRAALATGEVGALLFVSTAAETNALQRAHLEASRLKIPLLFGFDVIHGLRTVFPVPIGMAASWDPDLVRTCQAVAAREARAVGIHWTFAPMVDVARDPRWGRMVEGAGEDPHLGSIMAAAQVRGFQDTDLAQGGVIAGPKHFAGYGAALGGRDYDEVNLSEYELRNVYLPPFRAALDAGAGNLMTAYMALNGVPATGNRRLLTTILREEWGFDGFVVSDANAVANLVTHGFSADAPAAAAALGAGLDLEMTVGSAAFRHLPEAIERGLVDPAALDRAVLRVLQAKERLGLFEQPFVDEGETARVLADPAHRTLASRAAARSAVLLRNEEALLPIMLKDVGRMALLGPLADSARDTLGPWIFDYDLSETVTLRQGLASGAPKGVIVDYAPGVPLPERKLPWPFGMLHDDDASDAPFDEQAELTRAVALAAAADVAVVVVGERFDMSGEIASRASLELPGRQLELLQTVHATGTPVVVVVMSGRPLDLRWADEHVGAILQIWHGGTRAGDALADLLFGRESPAGRLPFTWPRHVGQVPLIYGHARSHQPEGQADRY